MSIPLLEVRNLRSSFFSSKGEVKAVNGVSFHVDKGEVVAIVGESGCGKSVTQMSVLRLIQTPPGKILGGEVLFEGEDLLKLTEKQMRKYRGKKISMIFQEPMTSLNPVYKIGSQITEVIRSHSEVSKKEAWQIGIKALEEVGIPDAEKRMENYPFELSGGMRQRAMIAISVACRSKLIIADEPTTALDVTTQAQVMELLIEIVKRHNTSLIIITHNLGLVTRYADRIYVMYAGRIIEQGPTADIITNPKHPYTIGLLNSVPQIGDKRETDLIPIVGIPPDLSNLPDGCAFCPRCPYGKALKCAERGFPALENLGNNHFMCCYLKEENCYGK